MSDADLLKDIEARVRSSICPIFGVVGGVPTERIEGRISAEDFDALINLLAATGDRVWKEFVGACEQIESNAEQHIESEKATEHEKGYWSGQRMAAKSIRRSVERPKYVR